MKIYREGIDMEIDYKDSRKMLIKLLEDYFSGRLCEDSLLFKIQDIFDDVDFAHDTIEETVMIVIGEIESSLVNHYHIRYKPSKEKFDLWQRLLLVLKSGAELREDFRETPKGYGPFRSVADIRKAYKLSRDFKKQSFNRIFWKPYTPKPGCMYIDLPKQIMIALALLVLIVLVPLPGNLLIIFALAIVLFLAEQDLYNKLEILDREGNSNYSVVFPS
jgi:hypothetical protein